MTRKKRGSRPTSQSGAPGSATASAAALVSRHRFRLSLTHWSWLVPPLLILAAGSAVYANSFAGCFLFDDEHAIMNSPAVRQVWPFPGGPLPGPRSLVTWTLALNYAAGGLNTWGYHAFNLLIHLLAGLTLYGLVLGTLSLPALQPRFGSQARWLALAVALLWVVHPLQTQSVTYIVQRAEAMTGLFYLLMLFCLLRASQTARLRWWWYAGCVVCCALGMLCKEVMCTAPLLALLYDRIFLCPSWGQLLRRRGVLYLGLAGTLLILAPSLTHAFTAPPSSQAAARVARATRPGEIVPPPPQPYVSAGFGSTELTWQQYARTQPEVILHYLRLAFWPDSLCFDYRWPVADPFSAIVPGVLIGALVLLALIALFRWPALGFVGTAFFLILAPTSTILPISDLAVEHRMYLPLAAVVLLGVLAARFVLQALDRRAGPGVRLTAWLRPALVVGVAGVLAALTYARNDDYASDVQTWADVVRKRPDNPRGQNNLGNALIARDRLVEATQHLRLAMRLSPNYAHPYHNLGLIYLRQGAPDEALAEFRKAVALDPTLPRAQNNLGSLLRRRGDLAEAVLHIREAMRLDPLNPLPPLNLAITLQLQGDWQGAVEAYRRSLVLLPGNADSRRGLAFALQRLGKTAESRKEYQESLRLNPHWPAIALRQAWDLATNPDPGHRYGMLAVQYALQIAEATGEDDPQTLDVLAAAYAEAKHFADAVATARKAVALARARNRTGLAAALQRRLHGYENKQPFRAGSPSAEAQ